MDPNAALDHFDAAMLIGERDEIADAADALIVWLKAGGFMPSAMLNKGWTRTHAITMFTNIRAVCDVKPKSVKLYDDNGNKFYIESESLSPGDNLTVADDQD